MSLMQQQSREIDALDLALAALNLEGHWKTNSGGLPAAPAGRGVPNLWRWQDIEPHLHAAGRLLTTSEGGASRRTLRLCTPGLARKSTTPTIHGSVQMLNPGEAAPSHRHSITAFRFVIQGAGAHTTVDGVRVEMEPHDLILTPQGCWHSHGNESPEPIIWLDGHDGPLLGSLDAIFFQEEGESESAFPSPSSHAGTAHVFKGRESIAQLKALPPSRHSPFDGLMLDYCDPVTGGPTTPTIGCRLHLLRAGERTHRRRRTSATVYNVIQGSGASIIGGKRLVWRAGDFFVSPNWAWSEHHVGSSGDAILFSFTDEPLLAAIGHLRTEAGA